MRRRSAPVKAPFSWPKSSLSSSVSGMAAQLMRHERRSARAAVLVDGAGDELLAGAALAGDQHRDVLGGDAADGLVDLAHGRGSGPGSRRSASVLRLGPSRRPTAGLVHPPGHLQGLADDPPQHGRSSGLNRKS